MHDIIYGSSMGFPLPPSYPRMFTTCQIIRWHDPRWGVLIRPSFASFSLTTDAFWVHPCCRHTRRPACLSVNSVYGTGAASPEVQPSHLSEEETAEVSVEFWGVVLVVRRKSRALKSGWGLTLCKNMGQDGTGGSRETEQTLAAVWGLMSCNVHG